MLIKTLAIMFDAVLLLGLILAFTGGYIAYTATGKPFFEIADLSLIAILLALVCLFARIKRLPLAELWQNSSIASVLTRKWQAGAEAQGWYQRIFKILGFFSLATFLILVCRHFSLGTGWDNAIYDQAIFNSSQGRLYFSELKNNRSLFADHFEPISLLLVPFYWLYPTPIWLFFAKAVIVFCSGLGVFKLAEQTRLSRSLTLFLILSLMLFVGYRGTILTDFYPINFVTPLLLFLFYYCSISPAKTFVLAALCLCCKEYVGIYMACFGVYMFFRFPGKQSKLTAAMIFCLAVSHYFLVTKIVMPYFGQDEFYLNRYSHLGKDLPEIVLTLLTPWLLIPAVLSLKKIKYLIYFFGHLAFLPLLAWQEFILCLPFLAQNLLSNQDYHVSLKSHYAAEAVAIIYYLAVKGIAKFTTMERKIEQKQLLAVLFFCLIAFHGKSEMFDLRRDILQLNRYSMISKAYEVVPKDMVVSAQNNLLPHFSARQSSYLYPDDSRASVVIISKDLDPWPLRPEEFTAKVDSLLTSAKRVVPIGANAYVLFK